MNDKRGPAKNPAARKLISLRKGTTSTRQRKAAADPLVWSCDECGKPIANGAGWITIRYSEIGAFRRAEAEWEKRHPDSWAPINLGDLFDFPEPVRWHVWHRRCDPDVGSTDYAIDIERIRTVPQLLEWSSHLMEKTWLPSTTWKDVLRGQANRLREAA